jgi:cytidylate kinase
LAEAPVIAVDGPSGTGKGTLCVYLAHWLGWHLLESGALYRVLAYSAMARDMSLDDEAGLAALAADLEVCFVQGRGAIRVMLHECEDISDQIRTEECGNAASKTAALQGVREALQARQRGFRQAPGLIADGRDMGTVVFPDAQLKVFLTASPEERAKRRYKQLKEQGISVNLARLSVEISERDARDTGRTLSPLLPAADAIVIDSTDLDAGAVCGRVSELVRQIFPGIPETGAG